MKITFNHTTILKEIDHYEIFDAVLDLDQNVAESFHFPRDISY